MSEYNIIQIESANGANFKAMHTMIHQVKSWLKHFLKSRLLLNIMNKNDPWQEGDQALIFPLSE